MLVRRGALAPLRALGLAAPALPTLASTGAASLLPALGAAGLLTAAALRRRRSSAQPSTLLP